MAQRGLSNTQIMEEAVKLVEEKGYDNFSLRELAARLQVRPASLYNHITGIEAINTAVALKAADMLNQTLTEAIGEKQGDEAFLAAARAYRSFADENPEIYKALIRMPASEDENMIQAAFFSFEPLRAVIKSYGASREETAHFSRALRSAMHGFVELTSNGFMRRGTVSREETYELILQGYLKVLKGISQNEKI